MMIDIEKIANKHCIDFYFGDKYNQSDRWIKFSEDGFKAFANELQNEVIEMCAREAINACLVPPDGGTPTQDEVTLCENVAELIRNLKVKG